MSVKHQQIGKKQTIKYSITIAKASSMLPFLASTTLYTLYTLQRSMRKCNPLPLTYTEDKKRRQVHTWTLPLVSNQTLSSETTLLHKLAVLKIITISTTIQAGNVALDLKILQKYFYTIIINKNKNNLTT